MRYALLKCHLEPKSWSMRTTPKLSLCGTRMFALKPCSLTPSQREPFRAPVTLVPEQLGSLGRGIMVFHICWTRGLMPIPRGSHGLLPLGPQFVPVARLY